MLILDFQSNTVLQGVHLFTLQMYCHANCADKMVALVQKYRGSWRGTFTAC